MLTIPAYAREGTAVNVDGDRAAAPVAAAMNADSLVLLSVIR